MASSHGNHNVYVTDVKTGKNLNTLSGHPRTPWCIAFHPSSNQILASGCLGGQVRVWDLHVRKKVHIEVLGRRNMCCLLTILSCFRVVVKYGL